MELNAIIGKWKGKINNKDIENLGKYFEKNLGYPSYYIDKNRNLVIDVFATNNPLGFYQFLSENGYILKDSKLTKEAGE